MADASDPNVSTHTQSPVRSGRLLRGLGVVGLVFAAFGLGALSQRGLSKPPAQPVQSVPDKKPAPKAAPEPSPPVVPATKAPDSANTNTVSIAGSIADEYGRALADVQVYAGHDIPEAQAAASVQGVGELGVIPGPVPKIPIDQPAPTPPNATSARTDQDGKFSIRGLPSGSIEVFVTHAGYEPSFIVLEGLKPGDSREDLYLVLRTPLEAALVEQIAVDKALAEDPELARISGMVLDVLGRAVPNALVRTDEGEAVTHSDANGAFMLVGISPGVLHLIAEEASAGSAQSQEVRARKGETLPNVLLHLPLRHVPSDNPPPKIVGLPGPVSPVTPPKPRPAPVVSAPAAVLTGGFALEARPSGLFVSLVDKDSAPARAGLSVGDVLVSIDGEPVLSVSQARGMLRDPAGEVAKVRVQRGKKKLNLRWKRPSLRYAPGSAR